MSALLVRFTGSFIAEFARMGQFDTAESLSDEYFAMLSDQRHSSVQTRPEMGGEAMLALVEAYAERGRFTEARKAAQRVPSPAFQQPESFRSILVNAVIVGDQELSHRMLSEMASGSLWMYAFMIMDIEDRRFGDALVNEIARQFEVRGEVSDV